jgi:uncharacterized membrane protein
MRFYPLYVIIVTMLLAALFLSLGLGVSYWLTVLVLIGLRFGWVAITFGYSAGVFNDRRS